MISRFPNSLTGGNPLVTWLNRLLGGSRSNTPLETKDFRVEFTTDGYFLRPKFQTIAAPSVATPGAEVAWFQIFRRTIGADFIQGFQVSGTAFSLDAGLLNLVPIPTNISPIPTYIAKQLNMRRGVQVETIDGVNINYTTPSFGDFDNNRTSSNGTTPQSEFAYPRYATFTEVKGLYTALGRIVVPMYAQCYVLASKPPAGTGAFAYNGTGDLNDPANYVPVEWVEISPIRDWISA